MKGDSRFSDTVELICASVSGRNKLMQWRLI